MAVDAETEEYLSWSKRVTREYFGKDQQTEERKTKVTEKIQVHHKTIHTLALPGRKENKSSGQVLSQVEI